MKTIIYSVLSGFVIAILVFSCEKEINSNKQLILKGKLISASECKSLKSANLTDNTPDSLSCINYSFDASNNKLSINHINAGFNCCQDSLYCSASITNDTIIIQEYEINPNCRCNCLFDLDIEINGVNIKKYQVKLIEPYSGENEKIIFALDLTKDKEGSYCVNRKQYPWGE